MMGPEGAADQGRAWLAERLPARLRLLEQRLTLTPGSLADPAKVLAHEDGPLGLEDWPAVYVLPQRLRAMRLVEVRDDASEVYLCRYAVRVLAWVRADDYAGTDQLRKRYVLAIREALLERKSLTPAPTYGAGDYAGQEDNVIDPGSIVEDYSEVLTDRAGRTIAGAWLDVDLLAAEVLPGPAAYGTAATLDVAEQPLDPHPAL